MNLSRFEVENHRGRRVPRVLGIVLIGGAGVVMVALAAAGAVSSAEWGATVGAALVFAAGLIDDLVPMGPRGLMNHLRALASGHMTTGILKMLVTLASAAVVVALDDRGDAWSRAASVVVIAGATNVFNGLDVRPGRALKVYVLGVPVLALSSGVDSEPAVAAWPWAVLCLPVDLRERAMLGDSGATLLGFAFGVALVHAVPIDWAWVAALAIVALNGLADTLTFSRVIEVTRPLSWFDRLGRIPDETR